MGLDKLKAALERESAAREEAELAEAREEAEGIIRRAEAEAGEIDARIRRLSAELEERGRNMRDGAEIRAERKRRALFEDVHIRAVKARCGEMFRRFMESPEYLSFLGREYEKAKAGLDGVGEIFADGGTASALKTGLNVPEKVTRDPAMKDGFTAVSRDGRTKISCTFDGRFEKLWEREAPLTVKAIAARLGHE